jgi:hypothetical protein
MRIIGGFDIETTQAYENSKGQECVKCFLACVHFHKITKVKGYMRTANEPQQAIFHNIGDFVTWAMDHSGTLYVHNLKFETSFLIPYLLVTNTPYQILESSMSIYSFTIGKIKLQDTGNYFVGESLDNIGQRLLGYGKISHSVIFGKYHKATDKDIEYCLRDCEITYKIAKKHIEGMQEMASQVTLDPKVIGGLEKKLTNSGMAFSVFMATQDTELYNQRFPLINRDTQDYMRHAYFGGLVGVKEGTHKNVNSYDIVNCYPSCMINNDYPTGQPIQTNDWGELNKHRFWIAEFEIFNINKKPHTMPTLLRKGGMGVNVGIIKEAHTVVRLCSQDYKLLLENYTFESIGFIDGHYFESHIAGREVFGRYIEEFSQISRDLKSQIKMAYAVGDIELAQTREMQRNNVKTYMNGIYGKYSTRATTDDFEYVIGDKKIVQRKTLGKSYKDELDIYYLPIAIFITAYARTIMSNAVKLVDFITVVNWDTDSIKTTSVLPPELISDSLGMWGYEFTASEMKCVAPKCYAWSYLDKNGNLDFAIKAKGISKTAIKKELARLDSAGKKMELFNNFGSGLEFEVLQSRHVIGGTALSLKNKKIKR